MLIIFTISRDLAETGASLLKMGMIGGGFSLINAFGCVLFGMLSDALGRRRLVFGGTLLVLLSAAGCLSTDSNHWTYFPAYFLTAVGMGMFYPPLVAWWNQGADTATSQVGVSRALIRFCFAWNLGLICGQSAGGWLFQFGRYWPLALSVGLSLVNCGVVLFGVRRSQPLQGIERDQLEQARRRRELSYAFARMNWIANVGAAFSIGTILHLFPKLAVSLNVPSDQHGVLLAVMRGVVLLTYVLMHHWPFWRHRFSVAWGAQLVGIAGLTCIIFAQGPAGLMVGLSGLGLLIGYNYFAGLYYSNVGSRDERRGFASGMHEATLGIGIAAGSMGGGLAGTLASERMPYLLAIAVIAALAVVQIRVYLRGLRRVRAEIQADEQKPPQSRSYIASTAGDV